METRNLSHPHLSDLLEPELISGELVGEAGRPCCKLLGHVPHTISKLKITMTKVLNFLTKLQLKRHLVPIKALHGSECRALLGEIFMSIGEPGEQNKQVTSRTHPEFYRV